MGQKLVRQSLSTNALRESTRTGALSLSDHHSCWCAWCTKYILLWSDLELHHIWRKDDLRSLLPGESFPLDCTVPVHKRTCHRKKLQDYANTASRHLLDLTQRSKAVFERTCAESFFEGNLNKNVFLREWARWQWPEEKSSHVIYELNALTGSKLSIELARKVSHSGGTWLDETRIDKNPTWLLYSGSVLMNGGYHVEARARFGEFEANIPRWHRHSSEPYIIYSRRKAIMSCKVDDAKEAVERAREQRELYVLRTAFVSLGWAYFGTRNYFAARDAFEGMLAWPGTSSSWWHVAEQQFGLGCCDIYLQEGKKSVRRAVEELIQAQYICALLALQAIPIPDPRINTHDGPISLTPSDVLHWLCGLHENELPRQLMEEIRHEAIIDSHLRDALCTTLTRPNAVA